MRNGACFHSGLNDGTVMRPTCLTGQDRPVIGCRDSSFDEEECKPFEVTNQGYWYWRTWLRPAMTEAECLSQSIARYGCYLPQYPDLHLNFFNTSACECYNGVMMNAWEWIPGEWRGGQIRKMEKKMANISSQYIWDTSALSYMTLKDWITNSVELKILYGLKSESLCSWNIVESNLNSITCDCVAPDSPKGT